MDGCKQSRAGLLQAFGGFIITHGPGLDEQVLEGDAGLEAAGARRQAVQLLQRGAHEVLGIGGADLAFGIHRLLREQAGAVHVQVGHEVLLTECIDGPGVFLRNVGVAESAPDDHAVLGLDQGIVVAVAGPGLGELGVELIEQSGHATVDVFAAVIGMDPADAKRKAGKHLFEHGQQERLGDALAAGEDLPLGDAVHGVDVVHALDAVMIALVDAVDADEAGAALGLRGLPDRDGDGPAGSGRFPVAARVAVARRVAQVVQVRDRDVGQPLVAAIAVDQPGALAQVAGGRPAQALVHGIEPGQRGDVALGVAARKAVRRRVALPQRGVVTEPRNQAREVLTRVAAGGQQVADDQPLLGACERVVSKALQHRQDVGLALRLGASGDLWLQAGGAGQELFQALQAGEPFVVQGQDHLPMIDDPFPKLQTHLMLESRDPLQTHLILDRAVS